MGYELIRDCWPDSSTANCAVTAKESEVSFRTIPFTDAWYFGAGMLSFVGKEDTAIRLLRAPHWSTAFVCILPWTMTRCSIRSDNGKNSRRRARQESLARRNSLPTPEFKSSNKWFPDIPPLGRIPPLQNHVVFAHSSDLKLVGPPDMSAIRRRQEV